MAARDSTVISSNNPLASNTQDSSVHIWSKDPTPAPARGDSKLKDPVAKTELDVDFYRYMPIEYHFCYSKHVLISRLCWEEASKRAASTRGKTKTTVSRFESERQVRVPGLPPAAFPDKPSFGPATLLPEGEPLPKTEASPAEPASDPVKLRPASSASSLRAPLARPPFRFKENGSQSTLKALKPQLSSAKTRPPPSKKPVVKPFPDRVRPEPVPHPGLQSKTPPADPYLHRRQQLVNRIKFLSSRNIQVAASVQGPKPQTSDDN